MVDQHFHCILAENDHVKITDFGLSKQKTRESSNMRSMVGTPNYWCPELVQDTPYTDKADVWALGCILYEMCMLQPPFANKGNILQVGQDIVHAKYDPIPECDPSAGNEKGYSIEIIKVVQR